MNYYGPAKRSSDGRWDYTVQNDREHSPHPIGYCRAFQDWTPEEAEKYHATQAYIDARRATSEKHHIDGHATAEEACECYKQYLLDHRVRYDSSLHDEQRRCDVCGAWTQGLVTVNGMPSACLCDEHRTRGHFEPLFKVGESFGSL